MNGHDEEREAIQAVDRGEESPPPRTRKGPLVPLLATLNGAALAAPLGPTPWLCRELQFMEGRPTLITAAAGTGKTWMLMSFLLAFAAGRSSWLDRYSLQAEGPVLHLNVDMGGRAVQRRYQRLAKGMGLSLADLGERVHLVNSDKLPRGFTLLSAEAEDVIVRVVEEKGVRLVLIDSLRPLLGNLDENKSECAGALRVLERASARTGATFLLIHHQGKPSKDGDGRGSSQHRARGSSAIIDASEATYSVEAAGFPGGMRVEQGKAPNGARNDPFFVRLEDVGEPGEDGQSSAVRMVHVEPEEARQLIGEAPDGANAYADRILAALETHGRLTRQQIGAPDVVRGRKADKVKALDDLIRTGRVVVDELNGEKGCRLAS